YVLDDLDLVLVMSVNPGFGGQKLIPAVYPKIRQIRAQLGARPVDVSIDGGVKVEHARPLAEHGASILVAGSAVFEAKDPAAVIAQMRAAAGSTPPNLSWPAPSPNRTGLEHGRSHRWQTCGWRSSGATPSNRWAESVSTAPRSPRAASPATGASTCGTGAAAS